VVERRGERLAENQVGETAPMKLHVLSTSEEAGHAAAQDAAQRLRTVLRERGEARIVLATGASQFAFLASLVAAPGIEWSAVTMFHLDEYIGLPVDHPASFRRYLRERFIDKAPLGGAVLIDGEAEPLAECRRVGMLITAAPIDLACVGIGENGHLAFNDPPADFQATEPFIVVELDDACRRQQLGEGWFAGLTDVPARAISMSIQQILRARAILCTVPERRKAEAVRACLVEEISPLRPASILRQHPDVALYLDTESAALLPKS
jgi:glucosamine-6-phosphate deaminase